MIPGRRSEAVVELRDSKRLVVGQCRAMGVRFDGLLNPLRAVPSLGLRSIVSRTPPCSNARMSSSWAAVLPDEQLAPQPFAIAKSYGPTLVTGFVDVMIWRSQRSADGTE